MIRKTLVVICVLLSLLILALWLGGEWVSFFSPNRLQVTFGALNDLPCTVVDLSRGPELRVAHLTSANVPGPNVVRGKHHEVRGRKILQWATLAGPSCKVEAGGFTVIISERKASVAPASRRWEDGQAAPITYAAGVTTGVMVEFGNWYVLDLPSPVTLRNVRFTKVEVTLWPFVILLSIYPSIAFIRGPLRRYRRRKKGLCLKCGYNLRDNVSGICPECGNPLSEQEPRPENHP